MSDKFVRKQVVFNKESEWHMEILRRIKKESNNFSGYTMTILKGHFDNKKEIKNEQPEEATQITIKGNFKLKD